MSPWLILFVGVIYAYVGGSFIFKSDYAQATVYLSYAMSTVGLYFMATRVFVPS